MYVISQAEFNFSAQKIQFYIFFKKLIKKMSIFSKNRHFFGFFYFKTNKFSENA